jgi:hypothetical protein
MDKWLYYAEELNWAAEDAFSEGKKGQSLGKLAGTMNQNSGVIDLEMGNYIQHHITMLDFIKRRADELCGITDQRKGAIDNRETVGGVERAVQQSSLITEKWFSVHDFTKVRALRALLETAKVAWKGRSIKKSYVLDDATTATLELDGNEFAETSYGLDIPTGVDYTLAMQKLQGLAEIFSQNGATMSMIAELYTTKDPTSLKRKIQQFELEIQQQAQAAQQAEQEATAAAQQEVLEIQRQKLEFEMYKFEMEQELKRYEIELNNQTKLAIAEMNTYIRAEDKDLNNDGISDPAQIAEAALKRQQFLSGEFLEREKLVESKRLNEMKKQLETKKLENAKKLKEKELALKEKEMASKERLEKFKAKSAMEREKLKSRTALKNKVVGER